MLELEVSSLSSFAKIRQPPLGPVCINFLSRAQSSDARDRRRAAKAAADNKNFHPASKQNRLPRTPAREPF